MNHPARWILLAVAFAAVIAAALYLFPVGREAPAPVARKDPPAAVKPPEAPQIRFPVAQAPDAASLPALEQSDSALRDALAALFGRRNFDAYFNLQDIVRRIVASVDNLPRERLPQRLMPVKPVPGPMLPGGTGGERSLAEVDAARYRPYVAMLDAVDAGALVSTYVRLYPLFQQAYRDLGYPAGYFNDRLVQVIDHVLASPEPAEPPRVVQRKVLYEFADPDLEARSAGQKIMLRAGAANAARVKAKLREIRRELEQRNAR